jgi:glycosyltransferase involved in cell wall biosynthesis
MHVLALTDHLGNVGGAEISARTILVGLADHEDVERVTVVGMDDPDVPRLDFNGVDVVPVDPPPAAGSLPDFAVDLLVEHRLARAAREYARDADVVHAHHRRSSLALTHLGVDTPTVATVRDYWPACPISIYHVGGERCTGCGDRLDDCVAHQGWDGLQEPAVKAYLLAKRRHQRPTLGAADCVVFIADHLRERLSGDVPLPERTEVIYNPVEIDADVDPVQFDGPTFVTASSLSESKGVGTAVRAMGRLTEVHPDADLVVFGDGPLRKELESLAADVAPGAVEFRGRVDQVEVYSAMAGATATVFPSVWDEPFGRITVESMMLGTPVVGSDVGGIAEVIEDGETGLLFPARDDAALSDALRRVSDDSDLRAALAAAGREASERFSLGAVTDQHVSLYRE